MDKKLKKCSCINNGKKYNYCKHWDGGMKKPWCYTEKCGEYSKSSKKYFKYCEEKDVNNNCNIDDHCFNNCINKGKKNYWCYVKKNSKNICTFEGKATRNFGNKSGNQWSFDACKIHDQVMKNDKFQKLLDKTAKDLHEKTTKNLQEEHNKKQKKLELIEEKEIKESEIKFQKKLNKMIKKITLEMENKEKGKNEKIDEENKKIDEENDKKFKNKLKKNVKNIEVQINNEEEKREKELNDKNLIKKINIQNLNNQLEKDSDKILNEDENYIKKGKNNIKKYQEDTQKKQEKLLKHNDNVEKANNKINAYNDDEYIKYAKENAKSEKEEKEAKKQYDNIVKKNKGGRDKELKEIKRKTKNQKNLNKRKKDEKNERIRIAIRDNNTKKRNIKSNKNLEKSYKTDLTNQTRRDRNQYEKNTRNKKSKNKKIKKKYDAVTNYLDISKKIDESKKNMKRSLRIEKEGYKYGPITNRLSFISKNLVGSKGTYRFTHNEKQSLTTRFRTCFKKCMTNKDCNGFSTTKNVCQLATGPNFYPVKRRMNYEKCKSDWKGNKYYGDCFIHKLTWRDKELKPKIMETNFELEPGRNNWIGSRKTKVGKKIYGNQFPVSKNPYGYANAGYFEGTSRKVKLVKGRNNRSQYLPNKKCLVGVEYTFPRSYPDYNLSNRGCGYTEYKADDDRYDIPNSSKSKDILWRVLYNKPSGINWGGRKCPQWVNRFSVYNSKTGELLGKCGSSDFTPDVKSRKEAKNKKYFCQISHDNSLDYKSHRNNDEVIIKADSCGYTYKPVIKKWVKKRYGDWKEKKETLKWKYPCHMKGKLKWSYTDSNKCLTR